MRALQRLPSLLASQRVGRALYATSTRGAQRNTDTADEIAPLGPFSPRPVVTPLQNMEHVRPEELELPPHIRWQRPNKALMRSIDVDLRTRYDFDERAKLFSSSSPDSVPLGSILLVEQVSSRTQPRVQTFAGVLVSIRRKGVSSNFTLRNYVLGTGIEMMFPVFSPMITRIRVLRKYEGSPTTAAVGADGEQPQEIDWRDRQQGGYKNIDEMLLRDSEQRRKMQERAAISKGKK
ncbi:hypothetical protein HK102_003233 [Quaeritorhiza haematococci]|nr:hypothetical protein HK102_003233 [Quaeritorhiza haematococci]